MTVNSSFENSNGGLENSNSGLETLGSGHDPENVTSGSAFRPCISTK